MKILPNQIINQDCRIALPQFDSDSIDCCVTSPPYYGLRNYGVDGQIGLETTPQQYIDEMVRVFAEVYRVLKPTGTLWLNLGDSYGHGTKASRKQSTNPGVGANNPQAQNSVGRNGNKAKQLLGIPWRVAFALQEYGWYLRQDIIWHKPNPMPESVRDRCTKAHEYIFLLTKSPRYYFDQEAIMEPLSEASIQRLNQDVEKQAGSTRANGGTRADRPMKTVTNKTTANIIGNISDRGVTRTTEGLNLKSPEDKLRSDGKRNKRTVWTIPTQPFRGSHFAVFPPDLIEPCILAGCPKEACPKCGKPRERITETETIYRDRPNQYVKRAGQAGTGNLIDQTKGGVTSKTVGFSDCGCGAGFTPGIVLDPFMGSGTTAVVAYELGRNYIGCEINPEYCKLGRIEAARDNYSLLEMGK